MIDSRDTIAAIATAPGEAGIGIVRISGKKALAIADKVFKPKNGRKPSTFKTRTIHYGWVIDDEALLTVMRSPKSFTREDVVEINCHGGIIAMCRALDFALVSGCRLAEPGEFTKRAFLNGRIDLAQAEAVLDIIRAKTDSSLKLGAGQLKGFLSSEINTLRNSLLEALAALEANIDFPEEEITPADSGKIKKRLLKTREKLDAILKASQRGRVLREGIHAVICGSPNVGKSSLLNALLKQERSIVTSVAGTTRDTIEEIIDINGIPVRIVDTAGIIEPRDLVEKKAVSRSRRYINMADIVILVFDASRKLNSQDKALILKLKSKPVIAVINKIDLKQRIEKDKLAGYFKNIIFISARRLKGIDLFEKAITDFIYGNSLIIPEHALVSNMRHIEALKESGKFIDSALKAIDKDLDIELVSQDIKDALGFLDDILGKRFSEKLLDKIFNEFCIGK